MFFRIAGALKTVLPSTARKVPRERYAASPIGVLSFLRRVSQKILPFCLELFETRMR